MENVTKNIKFVPLKSFVHSDFWYKFADIKLNVDKLSDSPKNIHAFLKDSLIEIDCTGFNNQPSEKKDMFPCYGILLNKNTREEFANIDKSNLINEISIHYYQQLLSNRSLEHSSKIIFFILISFADFKTNKYYYWFAFPVLRDVLYEEVTEHTILSNVFQCEQLSFFELEFKTFSEKSFEPFCVYDLKSNSFFCLSKIVDHDRKSDNMRNFDLSSTYFCCIDSSTEKRPSWLLRQFLGYLSMTCPLLLNETLSCICLKKEVSSSIIFSLKMQSIVPELNEPFWVGWETHKGKFIPRIADMSKTMDPLMMVERSINLNLTLMKWRLVPNLDLNIIKTTKFLLLGAGTLGCGVARSLMAWGAQNITLVDHGTVSLSNPVRQNLFLYEDAVYGKSKATTAAERLKHINPNIISSGYNMKIPMPGHPVGKSQEPELNKSIHQLQELIKQHDVIFLLTDSRESRWLPTMLSAFYKKIVITAALGFDTFLVIRHGSKSVIPVKTKNIKGFKEIAGSNLGCYFCNDVVAPGNSLKDRTLDQQCTVTRPAVSNIASSLAVELAVSLLQHEQRHSAPAYYSIHNTSDIQEDAPEDILGIVPHSIRGNIALFNYLLTASENFAECIACSQHILNKFGDAGNSFIFDVLESSRVLEEVTGISLLTTIEDEVIDFDSDCEAKDKD